jgi:hypothetical protein
LIVGVDEVAALEMLGATCPCTSEEIANTDIAVLLLVTVGSNTDVPVSLNRKDQNANKLKGKFTE